VTFTHTLPPTLTFTSLVSPGGWSCVTPAVGAGGTISCNVPSLPPSSVNFTIQALVPVSALPGNIPATGTVATTSADSNPANDLLTGNIVVGVVPPADLSVTNVAAPLLVAPGANVTYTVNVTNAGPSAATSTSLTIPLPASTTFVSLTSPGGWACATPAVGGTGTVTCTNPSLAVSGPLPFSLVVNVDAAAAGNTALTAVATATSTTPDGTPANNTASATATVIQTSFTGPLATGGIGTVTFTGGGAACTFVNPQFVAVGSVPVVPPAGVFFPFGLLQFSVQGCTVGSAVTFTWTLPGSVAAGSTYYKFGPTAGNVTPHWYSFLTPVSGSTMVFTVTDGGSGDDDLLANGTIVDQGGPGQLGAFNGGNPALVPTLDPRALLALMLLLGIGGMFALRRMGYLQR
ncbi:MAG: choice-of-anchor U domain-containing protein, partial [Casimicrobiaceae bacterium]